MSKQSDTIERFMGSAIFASRWMLAPFFRSLIIAMLVLVLVLLLLLLLLLLLNFGKELVSLLMGVVGLNDYDAIISVLTLVDTALIAVLLLIIVFGGYEDFVSKLSIGDDEDRPEWMGKVSVSDLKIKLISAIVAISAVQGLDAFLVGTTFTGEQIGWKIAIHLSFLFSDLLFAASDWISDSRKNAWALQDRLHGRASDLRRYKRVPMAVAAIRDGWFCPRCCLGRPDLHDRHQRQPDEADRCGHSASRDGPPYRCEQEDVVRQRCKVDGHRSPGRRTLAGRHQRYERGGHVHNRTHAKHVSPEQGVHRHLAAPAAGKERWPVALVHYT